MNRKERSALTFATKLHFNLPHFLPPAHCWCPVFRFRIYDRADFDEEDSAYIDFHNFIEDPAPFCILESAVSTFFMVDRGLNLPPG